MVTASPVKPSHAPIPASILKSPPPIERGRIGVISAEVRVGRRKPPAAPQADASGEISNQESAANRKPERISGMVRTSGSTCIFSSMQARSAHSHRNRNSARGRLKKMMQQIVTTPRSPHLIPAEISFFQYCLLCLRRFSFADFAKRGIWKERTSAVPGSAGRNLSKRRAKKGRGKARMKAAEPKIRKA